jgi:hypothetical protein
MCPPMACSAAIHLSGRFGIQPLGQLINDATLPMRVGASRKISKRPTFPAVTITTLDGGWTDCVECRALRQSAHAAF